METPVDDRLRSELDRYALRYTCEDCAHFDGQNLSCGNGFPTDDHRRRPLGERLVFCKQFELT